MSPVVPRVERTCGTPPPPPCLDRTVYRHKEFHGEEAKRRIGHRQPRQRQVKAQTQTCADQRRKPGPGPW